MSPTLGLEQCCGASSCASLPLAGCLQTKHRGMEALISPLAKFLRKRKRAAQQLLESSMCDDGAPMCDLEDQEAVLLATCTRPYEFHQPFYAKPRPDPKPFWALINPHWTDEDFIKAVRVDREAFTSLVDQLRPLLEKAKTNWKPHPITVEEQVCT